MTNIGKHARAVLEIKMILEPEKYEVTNRFLFLFLLYLAVFINFALKKITKQNIMKKLFVFTIAALMSYGAQAQIDKGDLDDDGKITMNDVVMLLNIYLTQKDSESPEPEGMNNGHEYVDLGLSVKWATCNVGASSPEEYGGYYAWGETSAYGEAPSDYPSSYTKTPNKDYTSQRTKTIYDWQHYKYMAYGKSSGYGCSKYQIADKQTESVWYKNSTFIGDEKTILDKEDDAASANWQGAWRMPTKAEFNELISNCYGEWVSYYNGKRVNGFIVYKAKADADKGKWSYYYYPVGVYSLSDPHIFLPAASRRIEDSTVGDAGGYYLSSSLDRTFTSSANSLYFYKSGVQGEKTYDRYEGLSVRAVCP